MKKKSISKEERKKLLVKYVLKQKAEEIGFFVAIIVGIALIIGIFLGASYLAGYIVLGEDSSSMFCGDYEGTGQDCDSGNYMIVGSLVLFALFMIVVILWAWIEKNIDIAKVRLEEEYGK